MRRARLAHPRRHAREASRPVADAPNPRLLMAEPPDTGGSAFLLRAQRHSPRIRRPACHLPQHQPRTGAFLTEPKRRRLGRGPAEQCSKTGPTGLRITSCPSQKGPMECGVHFCEYSASQRACIQIGSVIQHLYAPLYGVSDQHHRLTGRKHAFQSESKGKNCFEARYVRACDGVGCAPMLNTPFFARSGRG